MNPERKADHWSTQTVLTKEESKEVKGAENEKPGMEVDEVISETQLRGMKRMAALNNVKSKNRKQHVSKSKAQRRSVILVES